MKKLGFIAAVAAIALTSCQSEKDISTGKASDKKGITFTIQSPATRTKGSVLLRKAFPSPLRNWRVWY